MRKFDKLLAVLLVVMVIVAFLAGCNAVSQEDISQNNERVLTFGPDGGFRILHLSDLHEWMGIEHGSIYISKQDSLKPLIADYIDKALEEYSPDLVVLGGDNIFSLRYLFDACDEENEGISALTYRKIAEIMEEHNQYWTCTFGNHDSESYLNKADFVAILTEYPHFIGAVEANDGWFKAKTFSSDAAAGDINADDFVGNYAVPIYSGDRIAYIVYVLDSGSYCRAPRADVPYLSITEEQTAWYASVADEFSVRCGAPVPSLLFTHIPFIEVEEAYEQGGLQSGIYTEISPSDVRSPILDEAMKRGDVRAVFFGHNHDNSATLVYNKDDKNILLGITPACQAASYEDVDSVIGARVIDLNANGSLTTYVIDNVNGEITKVEFGA